MKRVEYFLPTVGPVVAELHQESASLYNALEGSKELDRLREMPQLGIVPSAWHGARHSRLEYILLTLHIARIAKSETNLSLNSRVTLNDGTRVSSAQELIQCWAILLNVGHLYWTFTAERILLHELRRDADAARKALESLLSAVPEATRPWALQMIETSQHYKFHQVLAFHRLEKLPGTGDLRALWKSMLSSYAAPDRSIESLMGARNLFAKIRRTAFLYLDAEFSPTALSLRLGRILSSPTELERLLDPDAAAADDELVGLEEFLARRVYLSEEVLTETAKVTDTLANRMRERLAASGLREVVETYARKPALKNRDERLAPVARLELSPTTMILGAESRHETLQGAAVIERVSKWRDEHKLGLHVVFEVDAQRRIAIFQAHAYSDDRRSIAGALVHALGFAADVLRPRRSLPVDDDFIGRLLLTEQRIAAAGVAEELLRGGLHAAFGEDIRWEWTRSVSGHHAVVSESALVETMVDRLASDWEEGASEKLELVAACTASRGCALELGLSDSPGCAATEPDGNGQKSRSMESRSATMRSDANWC